MSTNYAGTTARRILNLLMLLSLPLAATHAQGPFLRTIGGSRNDYLHCMVAGHGGSFILAGSTESYGQGNFGQTDDYIVKTDSEGNSIWSRTLNLESYDDIYWVEPTNDSAYVVCGIASDNYSTMGVFIAKISEDGNVEWQKVLAIDEAGIGYCIRQTTDGGFIIAGETIVQDNLDFLIIKTDAQGNVAWSKHVGSADPDIPGYIMQSKDGGYFICGVTRQNSATIPVYAVKTDSNGNVEWQKTYVTSPTFSRASVCRAIEMKDSGFLIGGSNSHGGLFSDIMLLRIDSIGSVAWVNAYGGDKDEYCEDMILNADGNILISGATASASNTGFMDAFIMETDTSGVFQKAAVYGSANADDDFAAVVPATDGSFMLAGTTSSFSQLGSSDMMMVHLDHHLNGPACDTITPQMMESFFSLFGTSDFEEADASISATDVAAGVDSGADDVLICDFATGTEQHPSTDDMLSVFPNPTGGAFVLQIHLIQEAGAGAVIKILDESGQAVATEIPVNAGSNTEISMSIPATMPAGLYLVQLICDNKIFMTRLMLGR